MIFFDVNKHSPRENHTTCVCVFVANAPEWLNNHGNQSMSLFSTC